MKRSVPPSAATQAKETPKREPVEAAEDAAGDEAVDSVSDDEGSRIVSRPDGYHWIALDGKQEIGPFDSFEEALADMQALDDEAAPFDEPESLQEAERDIGIADWIDPETGEPAEGQSPPHLDDE